MSCHQCANPLAKGIHTCNRDPFNLEFDLLKAQVDTYRKALEEVSKVLTVPAAEYVPAIPEAWKIIDRALRS